jgi:pSer/pThr/pTyr-binding forkhead associated (FHA) protein
MTVILGDNVTRKDYEILFNLDGTPVSVGREGDIELNLGSSSHYDFIEPLCAKESLEKRVSRKQFSLEEIKGSVWLRDLNSLNGTFVHGEKVNEEGFPLMNGDEITAGENYGFNFYFDGVIKYAPEKKVEKSKLDKIKDAYAKTKDLGVRAVRYFVDLEFLI